MRIIAGKAKGKKLLFPPPEITRPTSDRAKEALFSILEAKLTEKGIAFSQINFLDAFAGSGAIGLEALSRGVKYVVFVEKNPIAIDCIHKNLNALKLNERADIYTDLFLLPKAKAPFSVVFLDPPYAKNLVSPAIVYLQNKNWIGKNTICVAETEIKDNLNQIPNLLLEDVRKYGRAKFLFFEKINEDKKDE